MPTFFRRYESALLVMASWCAYSIWTIATAAHGSGAVLITDDAMRLAEVRDLLNGQSWFDTTQWRMNTPFGLAMHWSRLIDAGIAATYLLFRALLDAKTAETATLYLWPMLPFLGLLAALYRTARHLGGELAGLASLALAITCVAFWSDFEPGRLDHHNVQLALIAWMLCFLLESAVAARSAGYAAIAAAISLTIGIETLPYIVTAAAAMSVLWICGGDKWKRQAQYFGFAFAGTSAESITLAVASRYQWAPACDTYSSYYACLAIAGGAGLALCASFSTGLAAAYQRLIVVSGLFAVLFALGFAIDPVCLNGPYGMMDPRLVEIWLSRISEAQSAVMIARSAPAEFVFGYLYALMGLIISLVVFAAEKKP